MTEEENASTAVHRGPLGELPRAARHRPRVHTSPTEAVFIEERMVVGSSDSADIVLPDRTVSRIHCALDPRLDGLWVEDLDSRNGTYVNDIRVTEARLGPGDRIHLGATALPVSYDEDATEIELWPLDRFGSMVGRSVAMRELFARMHRVAGSEATVLLRGESGTGKEVAARALHDLSERSNAPFIVVDCGAIPEALLEAELFGAVKGAYTGATSNRMGAIEAAEQGTVFFDEIGELPTAMQPKLLRFLESRTIRRVGDPRERRVDVRVIAATHRDLGHMVNLGTFREDLYFRLAVIPLTIPPLRNRLDDIPSLLHHFVPSMDVTEELAAKLRTRPWQGNVRELRNFVERMQALGVDEALQMVRSSRGARQNEFPPVDLEIPFKEHRDQWVSHFEREYIGRLLERHGGNVSAAASAAGIDRTYIHRLVKKHGL